LWLVEGSKSQRGGGGLGYVMIVLGPLAVYIARMNREVVRRRTDVIGYRLDHEWNEDVLTGRTVVSRYPQSITSPLILPTLRRARMPLGAKDIEGTKRFSNRMRPIISLT
jgi:hypothetical protein